MKTTYKGLIQFRTAASVYIEKIKPVSVINEVLQDLIDDTNDLIEDFNGKRNKLRRKFAAKDPKTNVLLKSEGDYQFTEEAENNLDDSFKLLLNEEIEVNEDIQSPETVENIPREYKKVFQGFIL